MLVDRTVKPNVESTPLTGQDCIPSLPTNKSMINSLHSAA